MNFLAVFAGGGLGALTRYILSILIARPNCFLPYHTILANFGGCFLAGALMTFLTAKMQINPLYKNLLITGFCGGLSTLSAFSLETFEYLQSGDYFKATLYIVISLAICLISVILGILLVKKYV